MAAEVNRDGLGRMMSEVFGFADDGTGAPPAAAVKTVASSWAIPGGQGQEDIGIRRSLTTAAGFTMDFSPDAVGKVTGVGLAGPGGLSLPSFAAYRYEGNRVIHRAVKASAGSDSLETTDTYDALGYLTDMSVVNPADTTNPARFSMTLTRDVVGNVLDARYGKQSGRLGDRFLLDGFDRLQTAQLGVDGFTGAPAFDEQVTYGLDAAHNRTTVTTTSPSGSASQPYTRRPNTNEYSQAGDSIHTYDGNGNLISDGYHLYSYDYLDRLSEVYLMTYPDGVTPAGYASVLFPTVEQQSEQDGVWTETDMQVYNGFVSMARQRVKDHMASQGTIVGVNAGLSPGEGQPAVLLVAWYGYDMGNRRIRKLTAQGVDRWFTYDHWNVADELDSGWQPSKTYFSPGSLEEHIGFAVNQSGSWNRYSLIQNHLGSVMAVVDSSAQVVERYEYDAYGRRTIFTATGGVLEESAVQNERGFTGHFHDTESGLVYMRNRYYSGKTGRFLSKDRIGIWADAGNWGSAYAYVAGSPHWLNDILGLQQPPTEETVTLGGSGGSAPFDWGASSNVPSTASANSTNPYAPPGGGISGDSLSDLALLLAEEAAISIAMAPIGGPLARIAAKAAGPIWRALRGLLRGGSKGATCRSTRTVSQSAAKGGGRAVDAATPIGRRGNPMNVPRGTNAPTTIGGRDFTGHAIDEMQGRGIMPSVVENAIQNGVRTAGSEAGTFQHVLEGVRVITNQAGGVITVIPR